MKNFMSIESFRFLSGTDVMVRARLGKRKTRISSSVDVYVVTLTLFVCFTQVSVIPFSMTCDVGRSYVDKDL